MSRIVLFINKQSGVVEAFSSLKPFYEIYPEYLEFSDRINESLSRKKQPFEIEGLKLIRLNVQKAKNKI